MQTRPPCNVPMTPEPEHDEPYMAHDTDDCPRTLAGHKLSATLRPCGAFAPLWSGLLTWLPEFARNPRERRTACTGRQSQDQPPAAVDQPQISVPTPSTIALWRNYWLPRKGLDRSSRARVCGDRPEPCGGGHSRHRPAPQRSNASAGCACPPECSIRLSPALR